MRRLYVTRASILLLLAGINLSTTRPDIGAIDRKIRFHYYDIERDTLYEMIKEVIKYLEIVAREFDRTRALSAPANTDSASTC